MTVGHQLGPWLSRALCSAATSPSKPVSTSRCNVGFQWAEFCAGLCLGRGFQFLGHTGILGHLIKILFAKQDECRSLASIYRCRGGRSS